MNSLTGTADGLAQGTPSSRTQASEKVDTMFLQGFDTVQGAGRKLLEKASRANEVTMDYIRKEPVKSVLIAAATGVLLGALLTLVTRSRG